MDKKENNKDIGSTKIEEAKSSKTVTIISSSSNLNKNFVIKVRKEKKIKVN